MAKILVGFLSFAKFVIGDDKGVASFGPMNVLAGIGVLGLSFCFVGFSGLQPAQIAQSVSTVQEDPAARAVQLAEQTVQQTEQAVQLSQRACIMKNPDYLSFMFKGLSNSYHYFPLQEQE